MSLRVRLCLYFTLVIGTVLAAASMFFYRSQRAENLQQISAQHRQALQSTVKVCEESMLASEDISLLNYLRQLQERKEVLAVDVVDGRGVILAHPDPLKLGKRVELPEGSPFFYSAPVAVRGSPARRVRLLYDEGLILGRIRAGLAERMRRFARSVLVGALGLGLLFAWILADDLVRPIRSLSEGARIIGKGRLQHRIVLTRGDELGLLADEFNRMAERLAELDRMKEQFMQSITHDLRNPLTGISGYTSLLLKGKDPLTPRQKRGMEVIAQSAGQLSEMISEILDLSKLEAGLMQLKKSETDLCAMLRDLQQMFLADAERRGLALTTALEVPAAVVSVDAPMIRRVIQNFITNALKFTPPGGKVALELKREAAELHCGVRDTGPGIPSKHMADMFRKFSQVPGIEAKKGERGTGLGLALSKSVVEAHGGRIGVESSPGQGSRFFFVLPCQP